MQIIFKFHHVRLSYGSDKILEYTNTHTHTHTDRVKSICPSAILRRGHNKFRCCCSSMFQHVASSGCSKQLENVFVKHYAPNLMPDPKGEWSLNENISELHYGICSKVYQFIYTLVCNYMPIIRILAKGVLQISGSKGCSYI